MLDRTEFSLELSMPDNKSIRSWLPKMEKGEEPRKSN